MNIVVSALGFADNPNLRPQAGAANRTAMAYRSIGSNVDACSLDEARAAGLATT